MSDQDLTHLLTSWPYEPGRINARTIIGADGRPKLQVRIDLGALQMEMQGRPDGLRPGNYPSLLDLHKDRLHRYEKGSQAGGAGGHAGPDEPAAKPRREEGPDWRPGSGGFGADGGTGGMGGPGFVLSPDDCRGLREEAVQFYHRYVGLFALGDYAGVVRDATHNLEILDLCRDYSAAEPDRVALEQFRGPVIAMRARSAAELALRGGQPKQALAAIDRGLNELREAWMDAGRTDYDTSNEVVLLRGMRDALVPKLPSSQRVELQERMRAALDAENYELAAILRDELRMLDD